jgi:hypothetical protein
MVAMREKEHKQKSFVCQGKPGLVEDHPKGRWRNLPALGKSEVDIHNPRMVTRGNYM